MGTVEIYPPSPNWFQASCCAVQQGVLAYAARERIVFMDVATGHVVRMLGSDCGPTAARAAAVALAEHGGRLIAACAHENGAVRLWDAGTGTVLLCGTAAADTPLTSCALCCGSMLIPPLAAVQHHKRLNNKEEQHDTQSSCAHRTLRLCVRAHAMRGTLQQLQQTALQRSSLCALSVHPQSCVASQRLTARAQSRTHNGRVTLPLAPCSLPSPPAIAFESSKLRTSFNNNSSLKKLNKHHQWL